MTPSAVRQSYKRALRQFGKVTIRRYYGSGTPRPTHEKACSARVLNYQAAEIIGAIVEGDKRVILLAEDLETGAVALPLLTTDKAVIRGKEHAIVAIDAEARRLGDVLCAYELQVRG